MIAAPNPSPARLAAAAAAALVLGAAALSGCALDATAQSEALTETAEQALSCQCGADVTEQLFSLVDDVKSKFEALSDEDKHDLCWSFYANTDAAMASSWDVLAFYRAECRASTQEGTCGAGTCAGSVTVANGCYFAGHVNYVLWGAGMSLCNGLMPLDPRFGLVGAEGAIAAYRCAQHGCMGIEGRVNWTEIGWLLAQTGQLYVPYDDPIFGGETNPPSDGLCETPLAQGSALAWAFGLEPVILGGSFGGHEGYVEACMQYETPGG